jgi:hypothetical protein
MYKLIEQNPTKEYQKYDKDIKRLQQENEELKKDYTHKIELQDAIIKEKTERLQELHSHNLSLQTDKEILQKDKTVLYQLFSSVKEMIASMRL